MAFAKKDRLKVSEIVRPSWVYRTLGARIEEMTYPGMLIAVTLAATATPLAAQSDGAPGTQRMAERLRLIVQQTDPQSSLTTHSRERVADLRRQMAQTKNYERQLVLRMQLGNELLVDGKTEDALKQFKAIKAVFDGEIQPNQLFAQRVRELLGVSYLRLAEQENCIAHHNTDSCLIPIRAGGIHGIKRGSTLAIQEFTKALKVDPQNLRYRWLLNLAHMTQGSYPDGVPHDWLIPPRVFDSDYDIKRFVDVAASAGVAPISLAGGVVMEDFDGDGLLDLMVSEWGIDRQLRYYHNSGDGTFAERTMQAGLRGLVGGLNLCQADYNNDGHVDVLVLRGAWLGEHGRHPNSLLRNNGDGTFEDVTEQSGLLSFAPTQTAAWADYNRDGWIDLFVGSESRSGSVHLCKLYRNKGDGTFIDVAPAAGVDHAGFVKGVAWADYNNDGLPDLYLSRFGQSNILYRNDHGPGDDHKFTDVTAQAGVAEPRRSFPTWFWDYDNDGWEDLLVAPFAGFSFNGEAISIVAANYLGIAVKASETRLYRNNHDGTFRNVTTKARLDEAMLAMGANFGDLDNDGFLDCYFGTGDPYLGTLVPNRMFRSAGGRYFQNVTTLGGFGHIQKGHGIAFGDIDNDGDQDIYAVMGGLFSGDVFQNALFENPGHGNHWITLRLEGTRSNRSAIGARIKVSLDTATGPRDIYVTLGSGGSFGASSLQQEIGLGAAKSIIAIHINWPAAGSTQTFKNVAMDQVLKIREGATLPVVQPAKRFRLAPPTG